MNYRHGFHAGNVADVLKHGVLLAILDYLARKPGAVTVLDSHAGAGLYDRAADGEWPAGIGRLESAAALPPLAARLVAAVAPYPDSYPGSPILARDCLRPQDRLIACERDPGVASRLRRALAGDRRAAVHCRDGWGGLKALLPPATPRCLVLIDPPYETADDFTRLATGLVQAGQRLSTAILAGWYPVKGRAAADGLAAALYRSGLARVLRVELLVEPADDPRRLAGSGLILVRPPFGLAAALAADLPAIVDTLGRRGTGGARVDWLSGETAAPSEE